MVNQGAAKDACPRCVKGKMVTDNESGEMFCSKCGFVMSEKLQESGPEWRSFTQDEHGDCNCYQSCKQRCIWKTTYCINEKHN